MGLFFAQKAENSVAFKAFIYEECHKQPYGDYYVRIAELTEQLYTEDLINIDEYYYLQSELENYNCSAEGAATIFIPHIEEVSTSYFTMPNPTCLTTAPIVTFGFEYDDITETTIKYTLDNNQLLAHPENPITEEIAWNQEYDVWVFQQEELCGEGNDIKSPKDTLTVFNDDLPSLEENAERTDGKEEWVGIVQIPNINKVEPWIREKLELKVFVNSSNGTILLERSFGKWRRKNFRNSRWHDFGQSLGFWNLNTWGPMQLERWIEENQYLTSTSTNAVATLSPGSGFPTITITHTLRNQDNNLGAINVQFTDPSLPDVNHRTYNLADLNFKRRSE